MITAKDIFTMEREMVAEAQYLLERSNLTVYEKEDILDSLDSMTEAEWNELQKKLIDSQISPLNKLKNGDLLKMTDLNIACRKAADNG